MGMAPGGPVDSETIAFLRYQQVAAQYEAEKNSVIAPEVLELAEHHSFDERTTRQLDEAMKGRKETFDADMQSLWVGLEGAKNAAGLLQIKLRDMRMGTFKGMSVLSKKVQEFGKAQRLDAQAAFKLGEVMEKREDPEGDMKKIAKHLERSNKPSSLVMMMLKDLREGKPLKDPEYAAAIGSKSHEKELEKSKSAQSSSRRDRDRKRSPNAGRYRSRSGGRRNQSW